MQHDYEKITIALAGIMQAICLIRDIAQEGKNNNEAFETSMKSLLLTNPSTFIDVYGGSVNTLRIGMEQLHLILSSKTRKNQLFLQQFLSIITVEKKIRHSRKSREQLKLRIQKMKHQAEYFSITHPTVISNLADIYLDTIKPFHFRMMILGQAKIINTHDAINKIRALLLAAIRSAVLWRQVGGSRLHFLFARKKIKLIAERLLTQINRHAISHKE